MVKKMKKARYNRNVDRKHRNKLNYLREKDFTISAKKPKKEAHSSKFTKQSPNYKNTIPINIPVDIFLLILKVLKDRGIISKEQVEALYRGELTPDMLLKQITSVIFKQKNIVSKHEILEYWKYLMNNHQLFCDICGMPITTEKGAQKLTFDHIQPCSKGGATDMQNGSPSHSYCNMVKTDILPEIWELVGLEILKSNGIQIDPTKTLYAYKHLKVKQR